jgi:hypothetical protein
MNNHIAHSELIRLLSYNQETGQFHWRVNRCGMAAGDIAGSIDCGHKYRRIKINERLYLAHRLAWFYINKQWPVNQIDHIDRDRSNNRISNLREATHGENMRNKPVYKNSKTGIKGVHWHKQHRKYIVSIQVNGRSKHIGLFTSLESAANARKAAAQETHKQFALN